MCTALMHRWRDESCMHTTHAPLPPQHTQGDEPLGPPRLIVNFRLSDIDALDVIPAVLQQYTSRLRLDTSNLQVCCAVLLCVYIKHVCAV